MRVGLPGYGLSTTTKSTIIRSIPTITSLFTEEATVDITGRASMILLLTTHCVSTAGR